LECRQVENENVPRFRRPLVPADFERMNLPREFWTAKVQTVPESVRDTVARYLLNIDTMIERGAGMLLQGSAGVGKSGIGALVCKEARSRGYTTYFMSVWELRESIRARVPFDDTFSVLDRCRDVDVLVLDGLRQEDAAERMFNARDMEELVVRRVARKFVTIVTTQLGMSDINRAFPGFLEAVQGCIVAVSVQGADLRRELNQELQKVVLGS